MNLTIIIYFTLRERVDPSAGWNEND